MAIIKCKNCGHEISSFCGSCPFCGRKLDYSERDIPVRNTIGYKHQNYYSPYGNTYVDTGSYGGGWALGFLLGVTGLIIASCIDKEDTKRGALHGFLTELIITVVLTIIIFVVLFIIWSNPSSI